MDGDQVTGEVKEGKILFGPLPLAYQQAANPTAPTMTAFHHLAPRTLARFTHDLLRFLATIANKRCEVTSVQHHAHFVIIIAFAQVYPLRPLLRRLRSRHDDAHDGRTHFIS
ncbi:hypothetical protein [Chloroflexus sp. Y-396-1]|uniref:hypothetical protein n=1 Tax=Chloroflexus sp. Y-396-1 TaxID=867845 RepID=UPI00048EECF2|nr:hypothetical protein [Chloroflexus sp. Y-396-1]